MNRQRFLRAKVSRQVFFLFRLIRSISTSCPSFRTAPNQNVNQRPLQFIVFSPIKIAANKNEFVFNDSVIIKGENYIIRTKSMIYNSKTEIAFFKGPSKIISDDRLLYCENGWYDTKKNIAQIKKNAFIQKNAYKLIGDSIYYNKINNYAKAIQNARSLAPWLADCWLWLLGSLLRAG